MDTKTRGAALVPVAPRGARLLFVGGLASLAAAALHVACIAGGPSWYRALGAGERMASLAAAGHWYPPTSALVIAVVLATWGAFAWSGAGVIRRLPLLRTALCAIAAVYLLRGFAAPWLVPLFPGNSTRFWVVSSAVCVAIGAVHAAGLRAAWPRLSARP